MSNVLEVKNLHKSFRQGRNDLHILQGAELQIAEGEIVALVGPSGSGKSTLLHLAGLLEKPDSGDVIIAGKTALKDKERTSLRRDAVGFVYQHHHLLPEFSALENVILPQMIAGKSKSQARDRASQLLGQVGLSERTTHRPAELSGGEQQRVAVARALANSPKLLLADEPTGNLDHKTSDAVFDMLLSVVRGQNIGALIATHNEDLAARMDRRLELKNGVLQGDGPQEMNPVKLQNVQS